MRRKSGPAVVMGEVKADAVRSDFDNPAAVPINVIHIQKYGRLLAALE